MECLGSLASLNLQSFDPCQPAFMGLRSRLFPNAPTAFIPEFRAFIPFIWRANFPGIDVDIGSCLRFGNRVVFTRTRDATDYSLFECVALHKSSAVQRRRRSCAGEAGARSPRCIIPKLNRKPTASRGHLGGTSVRPHQTCSSKVIHNPCGSSIMPLSLFSQ